MKKIGSPVSVMGARVVVTTRLFVERGEGLVVVWREGGREVGKKFRTRCHRASHHQSGCTALEVEWSFYFEAMQQQITMGVPRHGDECLESQKCRK